MRSLGQFQAFLFFFTERFHTHKKQQKAQKCNNRVNAQTAQKRK